MSSISKATDLIPNLYDENEIEEMSHAEDVVDDLTYDIFNLTACNYHPIRMVTTDSAKRERILCEAARRATQLLVRRIFECPSEVSEVGPIAVLPNQVFRLPREKRIPEPKPETKWEKYAKEKNIKNKKKERMVWDEATQTYKPTWGYKRIKGGIEDEGFIEIKPGDDPYADPYAIAREDKKKKVTKNAKQQLQNQRRALGGKKSPTIEFSSATLPGIPVDLVSNGKKLRGKTGVRQALQLTQFSTASMGRFDEQRKGEPVRKLKGKKRSFKDNLSIGADKDHMKAQLRIVSDKVEKKRKGVTNSLAPYEGIIPDAPSESFQQKKGKGKALNSNKAGGVGGGKGGAGGRKGSGGKENKKRKVVGGGNQEAKKKFKK